MRLIRSSPVFPYVVSGIIFTVLASVFGIEVAASATTHRVIMKHTVKLIRIGPNWTIPHHYGAVITPPNSRIPKCKAAWLTATFWTSLPAINGDISGFNVTNKSARSCRLPNYPLSLSLATASGTAVRPTRLPDAQGRLSSVDFRDGPLSTVPSAAASTVHPASSGLTLLPGGTSVALLVTFFPPSSTRTSTRCLSVPSGGALTVGLPGHGALPVPMPAGSWTTPSTVDPTGSAFAACSTVMVSPFITWRQAVRIVGMPVIAAPGVGALPMSHKSRYTAAP